MKNKSRAFTLIELLVVVLIIGILAAVALPQYEKAVERARWVEALVNLRAIAQAHQIYYMANGSYVGAEEMDKLGLELAGTQDDSIGPNRILVKNFIFSPSGTQDQRLALAQWTKNGQWEKHNQYYLYVTPDDPARIHCSSSTGGESTIQRKLCAQVEANGTL